MKFPKIATRLSVIAQENDLSIEEAKKIAEAAVKAGQVVKEVATRLEGGGVYYRAIDDPAVICRDLFGGVRNKTMRHQEIYKAAAAESTNGALGGRPLKGTPIWAGEYRGEDYWGFSSLKGLWNATARSVRKCTPSRTNPADVPDLTAEEVEAVKAAAVAAGL